MLVERGGRVSKEARIGVRFHTLVMADSTELAIVTETISREGEDQGGRSAKAIGGAGGGLAPSSTPSSAAGAGPSSAEAWAPPGARRAS